MSAMRMRLLGRAPAIAAACLSASCIASRPDGAPLSRPTRQALENRARWEAVRARRIARFSRYRPEEPPPDARNHCPAGRPRRDPKWDLGPSEVIARRGYTLEHSTLDKIPLWVCEVLSSGDLDGHARRSGRFVPDPEISPLARATREDYRGSGFDRGHQAPAGNRVHDQAVQDETFFLSNVAPQDPRFNRGIWRALEAKIREWARERSVVHIVSGVLFYDPEEEEERRADGIVEFSVIGRGAVSVPTHFFKIATVGESQASLRAIAFVLANRPYDPPYELETHIRAIDWIEERTGFDFLPDLAPADEERIERTPSPMW